MSAQTSSRVELEDSVEYWLFPNIFEGEDELEKLEAFRTRCFTFVHDQSRNYIWHEDSIKLNIIPNRTAATFSLKDHLSFCRSEFKAKTVTSKSNLKDISYVEPTNNRCYVMSGLVSLVRFFDFKLYLGPGVPSHLGSDPASLCYVLYSLGGHSHFLLFVSWNNSTLAVFYHVTTLTLFIGIVVLLLLSFNWDKVILAIWTGATHNGKTSALFNGSYLVKLEISLTVSSTDVILYNHFWRPRRPTDFRTIEHNTRGDSPPHLYGKTRFGCNVEDEWFIVHLLRSFSVTENDVVIRICSRVIMEDDEHDSRCRFGEIIKSELPVS
uniref:Uncharacterized protein n=1 Tax=Daphnia galeata TaxID=27404 RepID=A0A8J2RIK6_9CRUS|nr:unnamed protein product [Daphnia galeata]